MNNKGKTPLKCQNPSLWKSVPECFNKSPLIFCLSIFIFISLKKMSFILVQMPKVVCSSLGKCCCTEVRNHLSGPSAEIKIYSVGAKCWRQHCTQIIGYKLWVLRWQHLLPLITCWGTGNSIISSALSHVRVEQIGKSALLLWELLSSQQCLMDGSRTHKDKWQTTCLLQGLGPKVHMKMEQLTHLSRRTGPGVPLAQPELVCEVW